MATSLSVLRATSLQSSSPSEILEMANNVLVKDMPPSMFVTCLYIVLDPVNGNLQVANAGHNYPLFNGAGDIHEIRAKGMPLGLIPGSSYEGQVSHLSGGDNLLLYSDGLVEAHNQEGEMFGFQRLQQLLEAGDSVMGDSDLPTIQWLVDALTDFVGTDEEQEDDVTLVYLGRDGVLEA
jgi:serine phosphatase RsbU (regulator of sigma subunit)